MSVHQRALDSMDYVEKGGHRAEDYPTRAFHIKLDEVKSVMLTRDEKMLESLNVSMAPIV